MTILRALIFAATALGAGGISGATELFDPGDSTLQVMWSTPIIADPPPPGVGIVYKQMRGKGFILRAAAETDGEKIAFLADLFDPSSLHQVLLNDAEHSGPEASRTLSQDGRVLTLAGNGGNDLWVGGFAHRRIGLASDVHSDAFLSQLDPHGGVRWQRTYNFGPMSAIKGVAATPNGDVAVVSTGGVEKPGALALIDGNDGHVIWERNLGNAKDVAVASLGASELMVSSIEPAPDGTVYREDVVVRTATASGELSAPRIIRRAINSNRSGWFGTLRMAATKDEAFIVSSWEVPFLPSGWKPSEVARVRPDGTLLWSTVLSDSFVPETARGGARFCTEPAVGALPDGAAIVACALNDRIRLHRLDQQTGADQLGTLPLPPCNDGLHPVSLFLFVRQDGTVLMAGTRPASNVGPGCSWMARLVTRSTGPSTTP